MVNRVDTGDFLNLSETSLSLSAAKNTHVRQRRHDRSRFRVPPMLVHRYVEENGSAAMLASKSSAGVTQAVNGPIRFKVSQYIYTHFLLAQVRYYNC